MKEKATKIVPNGSHIFIILAALAFLAIMATVLIPGPAMSILVVPESRLSASAETANGGMTKEISFRNIFGLNADEDYVQSVNAQYPVDPLYGVALTPNEQDLMNLRNDVQANLQTIDAYAAENAPDTYADLYRDREGLVYVGFTKDAEKHLANLKSQFKYPELLRLFPAMFSKAQLDETTQRITADLTRLRSQGIMIYTVGPNIQANSVDVTVDNANSETITLIKSRYGLHVNVATGLAPVTSDRGNDPPPWKGGYQIWKDLGNGWAKVCTSAFVGRAPYLNILGQLQYNYYLFTAGHCFNQGDTINHTIYTVGNVTNRSWPIGGTTNSDSEVIRINDALKSNLVYKLSSTDSVSITSQQAVGTDHIGDFVCQSGQTSGYRCGFIKAIRESVVMGVGGQYVTLTDARYSNVDSCFGDSGGAELSGNTAVGIASGRFGDETVPCGQAVGIYTLIGHATEKLGVYVNPQ